MPYRFRWISLRGLGALVLCVAIASVAWLVLRSPKPLFPETPLPSPNGHDDFVAAGQSLTGGDFDSKTATADQMRGYVSSNTAALTRLRLGLTRPARVPIKFTMDDAARRLDALGSMKRLTMLLLTEGRVSEADQRTDDALSSRLDALRFSHESVRGGLLIDMLVGVACEAMALGPLERSLGGLDAAQCRRAIQVIQAVERARESAAEVLDREHTWSRRVWGWRGDLARMLPSSAQSLRQGEQKATSKRAQVDRQRGAVLIKLACRAYRLETGRAPDRWEELVPRHLERIPTDPNSGQPLPLDPGTAE